ncbi:MAG: hypothetical protein ACRDRA_11770 [Pseudonocardiaceae bacterium]
MSGLRRVHLLCADEALAEGYRPGVYLAVCGEVIGGLSLPSARCPDECDCEIAYCPACLRAATERNWDAGVDVDCPPGIIVRTAR